MNLLGLLRRSTAILLLALAACAKPSEQAPTSDAPSSPAAEPTAPASVGVAEPALSAPRAPEATAPSAPARAVPTLPSEPTPRPTKEEWATAEAVNTGDPTMRPVGCTLHVVRDWVRVSCGTIRTTGVNNGRPGVDWFDDLFRGFEMRMQRGKMQTATWWADLGTVTLTVVWPPDAKQPVHVALETQPKGYIGPRKEPGRMSEIPREPSPRPTEVEWFLAPEVNDAVAESRPKQCAMKAVREWVRVVCADRPLLLGVTGAGKLGVDHFTASDLMTTSLIVRVSAGADTEAHFLFDGPRVVLRALWNESQTKRPVVALGRLEGT